ncbi:MAG: riboflavin biosynthesis protein RibF [Firmicutes bacterium]|nr:riboflavin biosynthesis protein RibF [Bacillota bacterium]
MVSLGTFDGVHRGHVAILNEATRQARACAADSVALTFDRLPLELLRPSEAPLLLTPPDERMRLLGRHVDRVVSLRFDWPLAKLAPSEFVERVLIEGLGAQAIVVGFNYTFGRQGNGNADTLLGLGRRLGVPVTVVPPVSSGLGPISSTAIRHFVAAGDMQSAADMLGRPFALIGQVDKGYARGRKLGFPTANIVCHRRQILPSEGVYVSEAGYADGRFIGDAVTAISRQPTFSGRSITIECHILDYAGDLYGERLEIRLHKRLRTPMRFASAEELREQIDRDIAAARDFLRILRLHDGEDMIDLSSGTLS